jgi:SAM-dependent methyltransferase
LELDGLFNSQLEYNQLYNCDGLILSPFTGEREIKIKPRSKMTIDLLFENQRWMDRDNNDWSHLIISNINNTNGRIYRCYPIIENLNIKFKVESCRFDKKRPNNYYIIDNIINMINYDWTQDLNNPESFYYGTKKKIKSQILIDILGKQNELLKNQIEKLTPLTNKNWLDLGCGKGKLVPMIKKYNPKNYLGLDIDIKQLVQAIKYHDRNQNVYNFSPCNLISDWNKTNNKWMDLKNNNKFDYIIANFSLMHFFSDDFWTQLNSVTHSNTKFMFNLVNTKDETYTWSESESFIQVKNGLTMYQFEWTHNQTKSEPYINEKIVNEYLEKYNWKVLDKYTPDTRYTLINLYTWWIVGKN